MLVEEGAVGFCLARTLDALDSHGEQKRFALLENMVEPGATFVAFGRLGLAALGGVLGFYPPELELIPFGYHLALEFRSHSLQNEDRSDLFPNQISGAKEEVSVEEYV